MADSPYTFIKSEADIQPFRTAVHGLHDGYITHVEYEHTGITAHENCLYFDDSKRRLILHIYVTSLPGHPTVELLFQGVTEWQIKDSSYDIVDCSVLRLENGMLLWADDNTPSIAELKCGSYVIAASIAYRQLS